MPDTTPVDPTVATVVETLLHTPPVIALLNAVVAPTHIVVVPVIAGTLGLTFTVTTHVLKQVPLAIYEMTVVPAVNPVTTPAEEMVPTAVLLLLHVPPEVAQINVVVDPLHKLNVPVIGAVQGALITTV
jgi:hypothetical protein